jgi:hypothetical protein
MTQLARPRSNWGAAKPKKNPVRVNWDASTVVRAHHTVTRKPKGSTRKLLIEDEQRCMREIQNGAMKGKDAKYSDIPYGYLIMPSGRRYTGRGAEILGGHTLGHNTDVGIAFVGNYEEYKPTVASLVSFWQLRRELRKRYGISVKVYPHSDTFPTACPGKYLKKALKI